MPESLEYQLRIWIARFILGRLTLESFEDKFLAATWGVKRDDDPVIAQLVAEVELRLAEYTSGHLTMRQLKRALADVNAGTGVVGGERGVSGFGVAGRNDTARPVSSSRRPVLA